MQHGFQQQMHDDCYTVPLSAATVCFMSHMCGNGRTARLCLSPPTPTDRQVAAPVPDMSGCKWADVRQARGGEWDLFTRDSHGMAWRVKASFSCQLLTADTCTWER